MTDGSSDASIMSYQLLATSPEAVDDANTAPEQIVTELRVELASSGSDDDTRRRGHERSLRAGCAIDGKCGTLCRFGDDPIAAFALGAIERLVGAAEQLLAVRPAPRSMTRYRY